MLNDVLGLGRPQSTSDCKSLKHGAIDRIEVAPSRRIVAVANAHQQTGASCFHLQFRSCCAFYTRSAMLRHQNHAPTNQLLLADLFAGKTPQPLPGQSVRKGRGEKFHLELHVSANEGSTDYGCSSRSATTTIARVAWVPGFLSKTVKHTWFWSFSASGRPSSPPLGFVPVPAVNDSTRKSCVEGLTGDEPPVRTTRFTPESGRYSHNARPL